MMTQSRRGHRSRSLLRLRVDVLAPDTSGLSQSRLMQKSRSPWQRGRRQRRRDGSRYITFVGQVEIGEAECGQYGCASRRFFTSHRWHFLWVGGQVRLEVKTRCRPSGPVSSPATVLSPCRAHRRTTAPPHRHCSSAPRFLQVLATYGSHAPACLFYTSCHLFYGILVSPSLQHDIIRISLQRVDSPLFFHHHEISDLNLTCWPTAV